jgi:phage tail sheath protein FI
MDQAVPGVRHQSVVLAAPARLRTGVPGFVGFALPGTRSQAPVALQRKEDFPRAFQQHEKSFLADIVAGFFDNGGERCYVVGAAADPDSDAKVAVDAFEAALAKLAPLADLDLVAVPDAMALKDGRVALSVQQAALRHCFEQGNRLAILDPRQDAAPDAVVRQRKALVGGMAEPVSGALYYPWAQLRGQRRVPPCGHVAGIYARTDAKAGVFKAPANEEILGIVDLEVQVDADAQAELNPEGVNCLRAFPGRGVRLWGARTLSRQDEWRYVNVRRLFLTVRRWVAINMTWAAFEPNDTRLWNRIRRELEAYLSQLWREGALAGATPEESYFVRCDAETNPPEGRELGQVVTEIGLAPAAPAEFIVVRITQHANNAA